MLIMQMTDNAETGIGYVMDGGGLQTWIYEPVYYLNSLVLNAQYL